MSNQGIQSTGPAARYIIKGHLVRNVYHEFQEQQTRGQRVADYVARVVGSWPFIIWQSVMITIWIGFNTYLAYMKVFDPSYFNTWDPYPFILLNLVLSFQAAYTGPVVMMSQNRQAEKDRLMAEQDYQINKKAEDEIKVIMAHLVHQDEFMNKLMSRLDELRKCYESEQKAQSPSAANS
ncbi:DUF1003 domain-containing protein [Sporomusa sp.]|uniref:DUF1003 domain-containing protein n=1 Tax=Sporomusa sp. TaxID=2078658 RepID=UPI002BEF6FEA|nr:DUF1003 domain-containing protein [Sporomusa sp.]HWR42119.1 DUF1003 domain-containing protein [Sporomusa sp.]